MASAPSSREESPERGPTLPREEELHNLGPSPELEEMQYGDLKDIEPDGDRSYQVILRGTGIAAWDPAVRRHLEEVIGPSGEQPLLEYVEDVLKHRSTFVSPRKAGERGLAVWAHPLRGRAAEAVEIMMQWWGLMLDQWDAEGPVGTIISPAVGLDGITKLLAKASDMEYVLVDPRSRAAPCRKEQSEKLARLWEQAKAHKVRYTPIRDAEEMGSEVQSYVSGPVADQQDEKKEVESLSEESHDQQELPYTAGNPTMPKIREFLAQVDRDLAESRGRIWGKSEGMKPSGPVKKEEPSDSDWDNDRSGSPVGAPQPKKHIAKTERASSESPPLRGSPKGRKARKVPPVWPLYPAISEFAPPLKVMPLGAKRVAQVNGATAYNYVGNISEINSDALLIFTNINGVAYHSRVRRELQVAGRDYHKEKKEPNLTQAGVAVTNGGSLPHYAIIHMRIDRYDGDSTQRDYLSRMMEALDKSLGKAKEMGARRVVISVDGLRSGNMPWNLAERAAVASIRMDASMHNVGDRIEEYVIQISPEEHDIKKSSGCGARGGRAQSATNNSTGQVKNQATVEQSRTGGIRLGRPTSSRRTTLDVRRCRGRAPGENRCFCCRARTGGVEHQTFGS